MATGAEEHALPSNRSFGLLFSCVFALLGAILVRRGSEVFSYFLVLSVVAFAVTWFRPSLLTPLNRLWMRFGALLHQVVTPIVIGVIFFAIITPLALAIRFARRDALRRCFDAEAESYWIKRDPPGPDATSFINQF